MSMTESLQSWGQDAAHPVPPSRTAAEKQVPDRDMLRTRRSQLIAQQRAVRPRDASDAEEERIGEEIDHINEQLAAMEGGKKKK